MKVILKLDVYHHTPDNKRFWERQVWIAEWGAMRPRAECDPLLLVKEHEAGGEYQLFRLDDYRTDEVAYRPVPFDASHEFLNALPKWGFKMEPIINREDI